jgi:hypothetical protein
MTEDMPSSGGLQGWGCAGRGAWLRKELALNAMIDWCLAEQLIQLEDRDGYPLLVYGERGLAIDIELAAREFLEEILEGE